MSKKTRLYILLTLTTLFFVAMSVLLIVIISVKISGKQKIEIISTNGTNPEFVVTAIGVFGSKSESKSVDGIVYLNGYYRNVEIFVDHDVANIIKSVNFSCENVIQSLRISDFETHINGKSTVLKTSKSFSQNKSFLQKSFEIISYEISKPISLDIVLLIGITAILVSVFYFFKRLKRIDKSQMKSMFGRMITSLSVFCLGFVFWIIVVLLLLEISLRIVGLVFNSKESNEKIVNDDGKLVVLCVGDSFTYGVGSTNGNDYPAQLQKLLQENTDQKVIVVNSGRCAQNSAQTVEKLQADLNSCNPDVVIMLYGMANSWNYYGYQKADNYWERIRIVKLFRRISYNIKYKGASSDTKQNVDDYAFTYLFKSLDFPRFGTGSDKRYYYVGRHYLALRDWENSFKYLSFALSKDPRNIEYYNSLKVCLREFDNEKFYNSESGLIDTTIVGETIFKLDEIIKDYPDAVIFQILKESYMVEKNHSTYSEQTSFFYRNEILNNFDYALVSLVEDSYNNRQDSISSFYEDIITSDNHCFVEMSQLWLCIKHRDMQEAEILSKDSVYCEDSLSMRLYSAAMVIIAISSNLDIPDTGILSVSEINYLKGIYENLEGLNDADFLKGIREIFDYIVFAQNGADQMYFLPHKLKRSVSIEQSKVFDWIASDIDKAVQICLKQNYPVICMNYPIIPPPNSEEISFWADSVGKIWFYTAKKYNLPFIDNDSVFKSKGTEQNTYFEPHSTGSEHCNDKGYGLIASNICELLLKKDVLK